MDQRLTVLTSAETAITVHNLCSCELSGPLSPVKNDAAGIKAMRGRQLTLAFILQGKNNYQLRSWAEVEIWDAAELGLYLNV